MNFPVDVLFQRPWFDCTEQPGAKRRRQLAGKLPLREKLREATVPSPPLLSQGGLQGLGPQS